MRKVTIDPADRYFSMWVRLRDRKCVRCGSLVEFNAKGLPVSHQASHFQGRGKEATRFEPSNVDTLCGGCHMYLTAHPGEHVYFQIRLKSQESVNKIVLLSNTYKKKERALEAVYWKQCLWSDYGVKP